jgi:hypothetical protein
MGQYSDERAALEVLLSDAWVGESVPLLFENSGKAPPTLTPFVTMTLLTGEGRRITLGRSPRRRYQGQVVCKVYVPERSGNKETSRLLERLEAAFLTEDGAPRQVESGANGIITLDVPAREPAGIAGGFYVTNLRVPFYRDQQGV